MLRTFISAGQFWQAWSSYPDGVVSVADVEVSVIASGGKIGILSLASHSHRFLLSMAIIYVYAVNEHAPIWPYYLL